MTRPHYDGKADAWREVYGSEDPYARRIQRRGETVVVAVQRRTGGRPARILDVGCGTGEVARRLAALGHSVVGVEHSREMLREASRSSQEFPALPTYVQGSALNLPLRPASFDGAVCAGVLEHLMRRWIDGRLVDTAAVALREMMRVVTPGGFLVITGANLARLHWLLDPRQILRALKQRRSERLLEQQRDFSAGSEAIGLSPTELSFTRRWTAGELRRFLAEERLEIVGWSGIGFGPFTLLGSQVFSFEWSVRLSARLERITRKPSFHRLGRLASTWVLTLAPRRSREDRSPSPEDGMETLP